VDRGITLFILGVRARKNKERFGYEKSVEFSQRNDGWIQTTLKSHVQQNWLAYLEWSKFCRDYAKRVSINCELMYRARDVEMVVWEAEKGGIYLNILPSV
jgi:hypothetical protein